MTLKMLSWQSDIRMKKVLFLVRKDRISLRRYLLVARELEKFGINFLFFDLAGNSDIIKETATKLNMYNFSELNTHNFNQPDLRERLLSLKTRINNKISKRAFCDSLKYSCPDSASMQWEMGELLKQLNFDTVSIVKKFCETNIDNWKLNIRIAQYQIKKSKPDCIVYDLELHETIRQILYAAKIVNTPVLSMQHGEGFAEQYSNFPQLADYYIAYSPYNVDKIKLLGVEDEKIFLTGAPDTDVIFNYDVTKIKEEIKSKYGFQPDRRIILTALRPAVNKAFHNINISLIETFGRVLGNNDNFEVLIKCHNADHVIGARPSYKNDKYENFIFIDSEYPFSKLLKVSNYLITHMSSCIVEAILMDVPTIVIDFDGGGKWPDWASYGLFDTAKMDNLEKILCDIKDCHLNSSTSKEKRGEFIKRFRYKYDNKSSERIAGAINSIIIKNG
ncbi:MAG: UDP-N-acetyl glucosamine 2-epimerase [Planctomycetes bacterium]|nr:UDP-N-acetyl glucosamine 2-epimerase [Planctomycetota bacterium]